MDYFDLHCDTLSEIHRRGKTLYQNDLHIAADRADFDRYVQAFAVFVPDELHGDAATDYFLEVVGYAGQKGGFLQSDDAHEAAAFAVCDPLCPTGRMGFLTVENGNVLAGRLDRIPLLKAQGVQMLGLTWNAENELAGGSAAPNVGLTSFGVAAIAALELQEILIDVSHLNDLSFDAVLCRATRPFVASHSNARAIEPHPRNLTDRQLRAVFERGGLVGINYYPLFLGVGHPFDRVYAHVSHMLSLGGGQCVALGGDFDGADLDIRLGAIDRLPDLYYALQDRGFDKAVCDDLFFGNAQRFFAQHSPAG